MSANEGKRFPPEPLRDDEIAAIFATCSTETTTGIRNRALIAVMVGAGLRAQEICDLELRDLWGCEVRVRAGKNGDTRMVGIAPELCAVLETWLTRRAELLGEAGIDSSHVFCGVHSDALGNPMITSALRTLMTRLGKKAGCTKRVHPHGMRHSMADRMSRNGVPVNKIRQQLGHNSLTATQAYLERLNPGDLPDVMASMPSIFGGSAK